MIKATIYEAKTNLSELVKKAQKGETVIITSGREKKPVAKLQGLELTDAFFEPLPEEELRRWSGEEE